MDLQLRHGLGRARPAYHVGGANRRSGIVFGRRRSADPCGKQLRPRAGQAGRDDERHLVDKLEAGNRRRSRRRHLLPAVVANLRQPVQRVRAVVRRCFACARSERVLRSAARQIRHVRGAASAADERGADRAHLRHDRHRFSVSEQPFPVPRPKRRRRGRNRRLYADALHRRAPLGCLRHHHQHSRPHIQYRKLNRLQYRFELYRASAEQGWQFCKRAYVVYEEMS